MTPEQDRPIFQMRLDAGPEEGWVFPDETPEELYTSPSFTIAWRPGLVIHHAYYFMPGERKGEPAIFRFRGEGNQLMFNVGELKVPFYVEADPQKNALRYRGDRYDVLGHYGKEEIYRFIPVI